ncbi:hypothetical protein B0H17DRAFT_1186967 [Mycena rosella]|uniref:Prolyl 4-hydroxylase alpha subunit Fe(2+) 2OG dioxygenase domain-containing protein n=1 Tax=Mycena rosella TaxID=1033263 RepID=A0AAD7CCN1_MYCRO|nr:hypothetical protein B0H17DRAFT_1186967 [Mycena rosella]
MSPIPALLRTAIDLKEALDNAAVHLTPIGTCRTKATEWRQEHDEDEKGEEDADTDSSPSENVEIQAMEALRKLQDDYTTTVASGTIEDLAFNLNITRSGCEYQGDLSAFTSTAGNAADAATGERLQRWYEAGAVSGYGDVKAQETKVDPAVRDAPEIPASEFTVSPTLLARVQELWIRAEPYKIHLYGPGGKFKAHRDTPETDLVGTFLLGLGDTSKTTEGGWRSSEGALEIKNSKSNRYSEQWTRHAAHLGAWVAFYPDVDHAVRELASGYRAHLDTPEVPANVALRGKIQQALAPLRSPYGILLQHHYAGTAELNGLDAALYAAAGQTGNGDVKLLPVLIRWTAEKYYNEYGGDIPAKYSADVFPMTQTHVDAVLAHIRAKQKKLKDVNSKDEEEKDEEGDDEEDEEVTIPGSKPKKLFVDLKGTDAEWITYHSSQSAEEPKSKSIRFYTPDFSGTAIAWQEDVQDAIEHTGNESRPHAEDSIYLSYAVVVLPMRGTRGRRLRQLKRERLRQPERR